MVMVVIPHRTREGGVNPALFLKKRLKQSLQVGSRLGPCYGLAEQNSHPYERSHASPNGLETEWNASDVVHEILTGLVNWRLSVRGLGEGTPMPRKVYEKVLATRRAAKNPRHNRAKRGFFDSSINAKTGTHEKLFR
jgi:hypothetical protein